MSNSSTPLTCRIVATTPWSNSARSMQQAEELAYWFECPLVPRKDRSIVQLCDEEQVDAVLIADVQPKLVHRSQPTKPLFFHPGMAMQRVLRLARGNRDRLLTAASIKPGDTVIDATLGMGVDTLVLAAGVGEQGRVMACESALPLARLFSYAIHTRVEQPPWLASLLGRIDVVEGPASDFLTQMPDKCVDVVYFDPMFQTPSSQPSDIDRVRLFADYSQLTKETVQFAERVARRALVLKERTSSRLFQQLDFQPDKPRAKFSYGVRRMITL